MKLRSVLDFPNVAIQKPNIGHSSPVGVPFATTLKNTTLEHYEMIKSSTRSLAISRDTPLPTFALQQPEFQKILSSITLQASIVRQEFVADSARVVIRSVKARSLET